jgi:geranylgeranyl diphosphate synthase type II
MDVATRIEQTLISALAPAHQPGCPPRLAAAMHHAVFPRGARVRPRLCLAVAAACGDDAPILAAAAGASIELLHCASLVHDDLPSFDDAATRRGRPSVHRAFGEPLAILAGDALIVAGFSALAQGAQAWPQRLVKLVALLAAAVGVPRGIAAGQAWECEPEADLAEYQREKTGALFAAATSMGAAAAGVEPGPWRAVGMALGEAYQVADDILDAAGNADACGKPVGQDRALGRPSAVSALGLNGARTRLRGLAEDAAAAVPACLGAASLRQHIRGEAMRLVPADLARNAA